MDFAIIVVLEVLSAIGTLVIISLGLAIIFGMMRVINIAHGEFLMLGAYTVLLSVKAGVNIWIAMLVLAPLVVGVIGVIIERCLIQFLYGARMLDTLLATWGLSLFIIGAVTIVFGNTVEGVSSPLGGFDIGAYKMSMYTIFVIVMAAVLLLGTLVVLKFTKLGLIARGTMQNAGMAAALGVSPPKVYMVTFGIGAALTGLAGGILAPLTGVVPTMGVAFIAKAFITVIGGGAAMVAGTATASGLFGGISQLATFATTPVWGDAALLFIAVIMLRILPQGITGKFFRRSI
ncbi:MAG: branched-chain amino acid ABC transporter permease [Alphaproteobacteria bacterium]